MNEEQIFTFLQQQIRSAWALEMLVLFVRNPERLWTFDELVREMRSSAAVVDQALNNLQSARLAERTGAEACRFAPASPDLREVAANIERAYAAKSSAMVRAILTAPDDKLRTFADAFRFKGEPK